MEQGEHEDDREHIAEHDRRLPPDLVGEPAEKDEGEGREKGGDADQQTRAIVLDPQRILEEVEALELGGVPDHGQPGGDAE